VSAFDRTPVHEASAERAGAALEAARPSKRIILGLDLPNILLADVQTGVGPFLCDLSRGLRMPS
jgi:hypothetical protein